MSQSLQVSFRELMPNERLVGLAAERYRRLGGALPGPSECHVTLQRDAQAECTLTIAKVRLERDGGFRAEAGAAHADAYIALEAALSSLEAQLEPLHRPAGSQTRTWA